MPQKEASQKRRGRPPKDPSGKKRVRKKIWLAEATWDYLRIESRKGRTVGEQIDDLVALQMF